MDLVNRMTNTDPKEPPPGDDVLEEIARAVRGLAFGSVEIVVHEGKVVQIVRTEKVRVGSTPNKQKK